MFRTINDFLALWKEETEMTLHIFQAVNDSKKSEKLNENVRTLDRLAWHIVQTLSEMPAKAGLLAVDHLEHTPIPGNFKEISDNYQKYAEIVADAVNQKWKDDQLVKDTINMYGTEWTKSKILTVLLLHQTHHRAQMTVIMRLLGMPVPGTYGPSKEEWKTYGMPAME
jgi:uncharacterized damage-inducible protein DinB